MDGSTSYTYSYDHLNQLTKVETTSGGTQKAAYTYDAIGRRIKFVDNPNGATHDFYFDGASEIVDWNPEGDEYPFRRWFVVRGFSYIDELVMLWRGEGDSNDRPFYYIQDRLYNVWAMIDRAGGLVERYAYDPYGLPLIRESAGRGDFDNDSDCDNGTDKPRQFAVGSTKWDPRADLDDDGDVDGTDTTLFYAKQPVWNPGVGEATTAQAFSDVGNIFMFQGVAHFALATASNATAAVLPLNHHRKRFEDCTTGRWITRDPIGYGILRISTNTC